MLEKLIHIDQELFLFLNGMHNRFFDFIMYWVSAPITGIPLYLFFIYLIYKFHPKQWWIYLIMLIVSVGAADWTSVHLFKDVFHRLRPCHNTELQGMVHIVRDHCGGKYGFVSSHAANMFAIATFMFLSLRKKIKNIGIYLYVWAGIIIYSRIYLGVHFPADVLAGSILGSSISLLFFGIIRRVFVPKAEIS